MEADLALDQKRVEAAILEASKKHPADLERLKAFEILESMRSSLTASYSRPKYEQLTFCELRDDIIRRHEIKSDRKKKAYQSLIGFYFGKKGEAEELPPPIPIVVKKNGQLAWDYEQMLQVGA